MLLLNSKSRVFKIGEEKRENQFSKSRLKNKFGRAAFVSLKPIELDISRIAKKTGVSEERAQELAAESLVMGHFKVRKTGVFWWSPHIRNPSGSSVEGLLANKDRELITSKPL